MSVMHDHEALRTGLEGLSKNCRNQSHGGRDWDPQSKGNFLCSEIGVSSCSGYRCEFLSLHPLRFLPIY